MPDAITALIGPRPRAALLDELARDVDLGAKLVVTVSAMVAGAALYGAALGLWRGGAQIAYAAIKLPLVLIATATLTMVFNWMAAVLLGLRVRFAQVAVLSFLALGVAAVLLASLAPVALLFAVSAPVPSLEARTTHNLLYLLHTAMVGGAGFAGMAVLWGTLRRLAGRPKSPDGGRDSSGRPESTEGLGQDSGPEARDRGALAGDRHRAKRIFAAWVLSFALVGGEVAWALRPFVGSIYHPSAFLRPDALDGNVYEFVAYDVMPYLLLGKGYLLLGKEPVPARNSGGDLNG